MRFYVSLVACTMPDWSRYVAETSRVFGASPTRELDVKSIPVGGPNSYLMTLEVINNNREAVMDLKQANKSLDFIHLTFLMYFGDVDDAAEFRRMLNVPTIGTETKFLFCGTLRQIRDMIIYGCNGQGPAQNNENQRICNAMYDVMSIQGFRSLFGSKKEQLGGTFKLLVQ